MARPRKNKRKYYTGEDNADRREKRRLKTEELQKRKRQTRLFKQSIENEHERMLRSALQNRKDRKARKVTINNDSDDLIDHIKTTKLWKHYDKVSLRIKRLNDKRNLWIRDPKDWKCNTHNAERAIRSLTWHLLAKYPIPEWTYSLIPSGPVYNERNHSLRLFIDLARGKNIRKCNHMFFLTKRMAHLVMNAPKKYDTCILAVRWAQLKSYDCSPRVTHEFMSHRIVINPLSYITDDAKAKARYVAQDKYLCSIFEWFSRFPMLDPNQIGPMLDFILRNGWCEYKLAGRNPLSVIRQMEAWHFELAREERRMQKARKTNSWPKLIHDWTFGDPKKNNVWEAKQLLTTKELLAEGRALNHCVGSYSGSCAAGKVHIISFKYQGECTFTVEIDGNLDYKYNAVNIRQQRGKRNRTITSAEKAIVNRWHKALKFVVKENIQQGNGNG